MSACLSSSLEVVSLVLKLWCSVSHCAIGSCCQSIQHGKADNTGLKTFPLSSFASLSSLFTVVKISRLAFPR